MYLANCDTILYFVRHNQLGLKKRHMISVLISIVDDDPVVRDATADLLNSLGYTALAFESAEEFLDSDHIKSTGCLITDQQLPGLTGIELQAQLQADGYQTPIIFITAFPEPNIRRRALDAGAVGFLSKPYAQTDLLKSIETAFSIPPGRHVPAQDAEKHR
jgi:FixJ family two-component response regulator